jgi:uncharacterized protein (UPF0261 family)
MTKKTICLLGAFDTKGPDYAYVRERIIALGCNVLTVNTGVLGSTDLFPVHVETDRVIAAAGDDLAALRERADRGEAMRLLCEGTPIILRRLYEEGRFDAVLGMGGSGGTAVITTAMRALPLGVPKLCVSTTASGDVSAHVGTKDIVMFPSIVDVAGVNRISRIVYERAAGAICGMAESVNTTPKTSKDRPVITASMFGNTTDCVNACVKHLDKAGYETLVFHATGTGGRAMESLVDEGLVDGVLDITTTEWADEVCGGVFSAGPDRLAGPGRKGIPHLIVPGCVDMANFGGIETVPQKYKEGDRNLYPWNPSITLMRTNVEENIMMGRAFAEIANVARGPVAFLFPLQGVSILDGEGEQFCDREADQAIFFEIRKNLKSDIPAHEIDCNINDPEFATRAATLMLELIAKKGADINGRIGVGKSG